MKKTKVEKSVIKEFRKEIWSKFVRGVKEYKLIEPGDRIAVCISGGKDSILLALLLTELKRHGKFDFNLKFICMNPGYDQENLNKIKENCVNLNIALELFETDVFKVVKKHGKKAPCYLCARMRRGYLYDKAKSLGCNKIALGHHLNDVAETVLMNLIYNGEFKTMMPLLKSKNFEGMELIRPMYLIKEIDIIKWKEYNNLDFIGCACEGVKKEILGKRVRIKELIEELREENKDIEKVILRATENINLETILSYKS